MQCYHISYIIGCIVFTFMHMIAESFISSLQTLAIHSPTVKKYLGLNGFRVILVTGPLKYFVTDRKS